MNSWNWEEPRIGDLCPSVPRSGSLVGKRRHCGALWRRPRKSGDCCMMGTQRLPFMESDTLATASLRNIGPGSETPSAASSSRVQSTEFLRHGKSRGGLGFRSHRFMAAVALQLNA